VSPATGPAPEDVRAEIARAFRELRPHMIANARRDADLDPASRINEFGEQDLEQFLNADEAMFMEALEGTGDETRRFILDTALPPVLELGQSTLDMVRSNVVSAVMQTYRLIGLVAPELREEAARWLAAFHSQYAYDVAAKALQLEAKRG